MIKQFLFLTLIISMLTGCQLPMAHKEEIPSLSTEESYEDEYAQKFIPDAYHPTYFDVGIEENDLDKKRNELYKLRAYNVISQEEFEEKLRLLSSP
jgi:hypothetical protein